MNDNDYVPVAGTRKWYARENIIKDICPRSLYHKLDSVYLNLGCPVLKSDLMKQVDRGFIKVTGISEQDGLSVYHVMGIKTVPFPHIDYVVVDAPTEIKTIEGKIVEPSKLYGRESGD